MMSFALRLVCSSVLLVSLAMCAACEGESGVSASTVLELPADSADSFGEVGEFNLIDQSSRAVTRAALLGQPFVLCCFFTSCVGPCPALSANMAQLQGKLAGTDVRLVSLSVDPGNDTPEVLSAYARALDADTSRWWFLTGDEGQIYNLIRTSFKLAVERGEGDARALNMQVTHDVRLVAVDRHGRIRGYYNGQDASSLKLLAERMRFLAAQK